MINRIILFAHSFRAYRQEEKKIQEVIKNLGGLRDTHVKMQTCAIELQR